jgi:regulator of sigma E protease
MSLLATILAGLVMLGVLVVVHEFGHFIVAKLFKVGVPVFSVGMGPRVFGFHWRGTDYRLSMLPVGGYVKMSGADPFGEEDPDAYVDPDEDFMRKPVWQRLLVMLAGPGFNLALPVVLFTILAMSGEPQAGPVVGSVYAGSRAAELGVMPGDVITEANGMPVEVWADIYPAMDAAYESGGTLDLELERDGKTYEASFPMKRTTLRYDVFGIDDKRISSRIGIDDPTSPAWKAGLRTGDAILAVDGNEVADWYAMRLAIDQGEKHELTVARIVEKDGAKEMVEEKITLAADPTWAPREGETWPDRYGILPVMLFVGTVPDADAPAAKAGVKPEDRFVAVDGVPVRSWAELLGLVGSTVPQVDDESAAPSMGCSGSTEEPSVSPRELELTLRRNGELLVLKFAPELKREVDLEVRYRPIMGITQYPSATVDAEEVSKRYSFFEAVPRAFEHTWITGVRTVSILAALVTQERSIGESLGGPIEIFRIAAKGVELGPWYFVRLIGTISISLGIFNLLPVPVLDGGQILFYSIEGIRGRPLSLAIREKLQMAGVLALVALMLIVAVLDVNRLITSWGG